MCLTNTQIEDWFTPQPINEQQKQRATEISVYAKELAHAIVRNTPPSPDQTASLRKLRECMWTVLSAIALEGGR